MLQPAPGQRQQWALAPEQFLRVYTADEMRSELGAIKAGADDAEFHRAWQRVEAYLDAQAPEFILMQCGADSLAGDPITHLAWTEEAHAHAAARLCVLAEKHCAGRIIGTGGGGYNRRNLARAWTRVVQSFVEA